MTRLLLAGDTHGDVNSMHYLQRCAKEHEAERIIQLGDFGYLFKPGDTSKLRHLEDGVGNGVPIDFIDGNHENFDLIQDIEDGDGILRPGIRHLRRGHVFEEDEVRFGCFGGAVSVDKDHRTEGVSWWPQEMITIQEVETVLAREGETVDVMLSHDVPELTPPLEHFILSNFFSIPWKLDQLSRTNRSWLHKVFDHWKPYLVVHGHYHFPYKAHYGDSFFVGLDCNGSGQSSWTIFDTEEFKERYPER